jgi:hypothetical protein
LAAVVAAGAAGFAASVGFAAGAGAAVGAGAPCEQAARSDALAAPITLILRNSLRLLCLRLFTAAPLFLK